MDGSIYVIGKEQPVAEIGLPLQTVSESGAAGSDGCIVEHKGNEWITYGGGPSSARYCRIGNTTNGREAFVIDDLYDMHQVHLYDSPTTLNVISPPELAATLNGQPFHRSCRGCGSHCCSTAARNASCG